MKELLKEWKKFVNENLEELNSNDDVLKERRRKSMDILELQTLLKQHFGDRIDLGTTGKNKDGVDGVYGSKTQAAINLLRKTGVGVPKRDPSFKKSVRNLIDFLKGSSQKMKRIEKYNAEEIGRVLKNMGFLDNPARSDLVKKLLRAQDKGTVLSLKTIKLAADTALRENK
tara:strand:+ start:82 stop:594 length:513 start_codon:yes stop_codon:yes gene_type:complete